MGNHITTFAGIITTVDIHPLSLTTEAKHFPGRPRHIGLHGREMHTACLHVRLLRVTWAGLAQDPAGPVRLTLHRHEAGQCIPLGTLAQTGRLIATLTFRAMRIEIIGTTAIAIARRIQDKANELIEDVTASEGTMNLEIQHAGEAGAQIYTEIENVLGICTVDKQSAMCEGAYPDGYGV